MSNPLISCIVPVYNGERFLAESLDSIFGQTYRPIEVIVVDDGSTDGTAQVVKNYGRDVHYLRQANSGPGAARNLGIRSAKGDFLAFNDADDKWVPHKLERQMAAFDQDPDLDVCVAHAQNFWESEVADEEAKFRDHPRSKPIAGFVTQTILVRRRTFDNIGLFDERLHHTNTTDWFMRAEEAGVVKTLLPDVLVLRRLHKNNRSRMHSERSRLEFLDLVRLSAKRKRLRQQQQDTDRTGD